MNERPYIPRSGHAAPAQVRYPTSKRAELKIWWREVDRVLLGLILLLMAIGTAAVAAASPASAHRLSTRNVHLPELYFYWTHLKWQAVGLVFLFGASALSRENARRVGIVLAAAMLFFLMLIPVIGSEVNGAKRWISLGFAGFQPSEFLKPGFAILLAWIVSWRLRDPQLPVVATVTGVMAIVAALLVVLELVEAGAGGREQHDIARDGVGDRAAGRLAQHLRTGDRQAAFTLARCASVAPSPASLGNPPTIQWMRGPLPSGG
jgi:cell division protein FtsW